MLENIKKITLFIIVFAFCSNAYLALWTMYPEIKEAYWFIFVFGASIIFFALSPSELLSQMPTSIFIWIILFVISTVIAFILSSQSSFVKEITIFLIKAMSLFIGIFVITSSKNILHSALYALLAVTLFGSLMNIAEFFTDSITWSYIPHRAAGWYVSPNISGRFLVMSLIFATIVTPKRFFWPLVTVVSVGVLLTFSRTSWFELLVVILGLSFIRNIEPGQRVNLLDIKPAGFIALVLGSMLSLILLYLLLSGQAGEIIKGTFFESYLSQDTIARINGDFTDDSANERLQVFLAALSIGVENPIIGAGLAHTYEWQYPVGPHNDYVLLFAERGLLGLATYLWLLAIIWIRGSSYSRLYVAILAFSSISTHTTFEQPATYIFIAIALLMDNDAIKQMIKTKVTPPQKPLFINPSESTNLIKF